MDDHMHYNEVEAKTCDAIVNRGKAPHPEKQYTTKSNGAISVSENNRFSTDSDLVVINDSSLRLAADSRIDAKLDDDVAVVVGQIRNGCDINLKLESSEEHLSEILQNMNISSVSSVKDILNKKDDIPLQLIANQNMGAPDLGSCKTVIPNFGQRKNSFISDRRPDDVLERGNDISNKNCDNVSEQHIVSPTKLSALSLACQTQKIPVTLHACNTPKNYHNHKFQCNFEKELVLPSESSHCTNYNSVSLSQSQRQTLFLKSQSLDIGQDLSSISCIEHDDHIFSQLPEANEDKQQHKLDYMLRNEEDFDKISLEIETGDEAAWSSTSGQKAGMPAKTQSLESRPIYPNVPYSPYASPYSSPRTNRRRAPLRESRRISIEQSGSFLQLNQYKLMDQIGQGSYGLVKLAYSEEDSTHYAMKILSKRRLLRQAGLLKRGPKKGTSPLDRVYREIAVLKKLDHPNVVKLVEVLDDPLEDSLYMVFELVRKGEVLSIPTKNPLSIERAWSVFRDTLLGLEYLHYQRIIHADIKPGNLLLTECGRVKIADLGVCNEFIGEDSTMTNCSTAGTPAFRAPETLNVGQNIYCGKAADIWALGATLFALVFGNVPFVAASVPVLYDKIKNMALSFPDNVKLCPDLKDCIERMLTKNPQTRVTLAELKVHPWVDVSGLHPLPSEEENCRLVQVDDNDINSVVRSIPKLDTLILIKTMLKQHSFGNPFSRGVSGRAPQRGGSRLERFVRAGRSNSAPGSYNNIEDRQLSADNVLPALTEHSTTNCTNEEYQ